MALPNVVIAGAPRCGTTSLFRWAAAHPQIVTSRVKETRYLNDEGYPLYYQRSNYVAGGLEGYQLLFPDREGARVYMEATPDYIYQRTALSVLANLPTNPIIVFLLRDPVDRVLSLLRYATNNVGSLQTNLSIRDCFIASRDGVPIGDEIINSAFQHSIYHIWLEKWISRMGSQRIQVYFFDDLVKDPGEFMRHFCRRIDIDDKVYENFHFRAENQSYLVRSTILARAKWVTRKLVPAYVPARYILNLYRALNVQRNVQPSIADAELIRDMRDSFAEPNRQLALLLGRDLPGAWV